jgi:hypothetical protein
MKTEPKVEMEFPVLSPTDRHSSVWLKLVKHYEARLESLRKQNDNPTTEIETAKQRGRIQEVKALLRLNEEPPVLED